MAYPGEPPNTTVRGIAIYVRDDDKSDIALLTKALRAMAMPSTALVDELYLDTKDRSICIAISRDSTAIGRQIGAELQQALWQSGMPGHGGIYVRSGAISNGLPLALIEADYWADDVEPMAQVG